MRVALLVFLHVVSLAVAASAGQQPAPSAPEPAVAILPFTNVTGDPNDSWIGEGIAEAATADLGTLDGVIIIGRETILDALSASGTDTGARIDDAAALSVGRLVGATWLISGSYQHAGGIIRVTARVVEVATGSIVEAAKVDGAAADVFGLQDRVGQELRRGVTATVERATADAPVTMARQRESSIPVVPESSAPAIDRVPPETVEPPAAVPAPAPEPEPEPAAEPEPAPEPALEPSGATAAAASAVLVLAGGIDGPPPPEFPETVARDANGRTTLRAVRLERPLVFDGRLDEEVYQTVVPVSDFIQQDPDEGSLATERTEAWIFFDDDNIYVAGRCWDSQPERMIANEMRRDGPVMQNENFAVLLDTFYDRRNGYIFHANPIGGMFDGDVRPTLNRDWNGVWDVRTGRFDGGWTIEMVIPFKTLRYRSGREQIWGVNLRRIVRWKNELSYLVSVPSSFGLGGIAQPSRGATLVGLEVPGASSNIEIKPYAITDVASNVTTDPPIDNEVGGDFGFDLKYGVTESLTADFTYNTDFAQVEADEQQVNLTRFSLFFPEKREFFLEGQGIFDFGGVRSAGGMGGGGGLTPVLFFSRRIGLNGGQPVPIDAGGRLTGKVGPFTVGALHIQTAAVEESGTRATAFDVIRVKRDILRRSSIGGLVTRRSVTEDGTGSGETYGLDGAFSFYDNLDIIASIARTDTPGVTGDNLSYRANVDYNGDRYGIQLERLVIDENFDPQVGFVQRGDVQRSFGLLRFSPRPNIDAIRKFIWDASGDYITNGAGRLETRTIEAGFGIDFQNSDQFRTRFSRNYELLVEPFRIRPGVTIPAAAYEFDEVQVNYNFGQQRRMAGRVQASHGTFYDGEKTSFSIGGGRIEVTPQISLEPGLTIDWVDLPHGKFTSKLISTRSTYTVTPRMYVGALVQYNATRSTVNSNIRFRWEYIPGSEMFVVYTEERDTLSPRFPTLQNRALVIKANRLFRF
jgi:TolB-like protein